MDHKKPGICVVLQVIGCLSITAGVLFALMALDVRASSSEAPLVIGVWVGCIIAGFLFFALASAIKYLEATAFELTQIRKLMNKPSDLGPPRIEEVVSSEKQSI